MNQTQVTKIIPILHLIYLAMVTTKNVKKWSYNGYTMENCTTLECYNFCFSNVTENWPENGSYSCNSIFSQ